MVTVLTTYKEGIIACSKKCFWIMKTDFEACPVYLQEETRIKTHFPTCFLALIMYRYLEKELKQKYTCKAVLDKLRSMDFASVQE